MLQTKPHLLSTSLNLMVAGMSLLLAASCSVIPRNYPANRPFVYETNIKIEGNFSKDERTTLVSQLKTQLDDSVKVRTVGKLLTEVLKNPPAYDSVNADKSVNYMKALLHSLGYLRDTITYDTLVVIKNAEPPQYRTTLNFYVKPGKLFRLDSISYNIEHPELQALTLAEVKNTLLKKGDAFSKYTISAELDRLTEIYRDNGYLRFTKDELIGYWDTLDVALLRPTIDFSEQILLLQALEKRRENPTANIEIRFKPGFDTSKLKKFYVGYTTIYPDFGSDTSRFPIKKITVRSGTDIVYRRNLFRPKFLVDNLYFQQGDLYVQKDFLKTINRFNALGAWKLVNIEQVPRDDGSDTVDFNVFLSPSNKYSFTANIEGSRNTGQFLSEGSLLGLGGNLQLVNRNFGRTANQATTTFRYGTELGIDSQFVQTRQVSLSHSIYFPKPIPNSKLIPQKFRDNFSTVLNIAIGNTERIEFFNLTSINASWGYQFQWRNKAVSIKIPNIEFAYLNARPKLDSLFIESPIFKNVFNQGFVFSIQGSYQVKWGTAKIAHVFRTNVEESGLLTGLINLRAFDDLYRFVKFDAEIIRKMELGKKELVLRAYSGIGIALETRTKKDSAINLPFFKQFYAGGPNSMRGWGLRLLGPGSVLKYREDDPLRFGDFQFEANAELRFPLTTIAGFKVSSALFTDIGNVWFIRRQNEFYPEGHLSSFSKFIKDLAVGAGTGLRINFEFLILRLDYGLKIKNPSPEPSNAAGQNKWFYNFNPFNGILQLGINYPFRF